MSFFALKNRFPNIAGPDIKDICYATQNRQSAVHQLADQVDLVLVVGAQNSSNSNRLCEVSRDRGVPAYLVQSSNDYNPEWSVNAKKNWRYRRCLGSRSFSSGIDRTA